MSRRIEIELTSTLAEGGFTWRAAGAKQPKGVVSANVLPSGAKVGDQFRVDAEQTIDGIEVTAVVNDRARTDKLESIELLPSETDFRPVVETRAKGKGKGKGRRDGGGRNDRDKSRRGSPRGTGREDRRGDRAQRRGPRHTPPPEVPTRPRPKRLKPGKQHRNEVLSQLPEEQRPVAELALQGMSAVRQRLAEANEAAVAAGRPTMPEATVIKMAEDLLPKLRVAEWRDRADAAKRQIATLDLRDLRSVVAAASDPVVARDESTRQLAAELQDALATKQDEELQLWFGDIDASLAVGRVIRALRLSAQPPKAGVPFPVDIAERLTLSANAALTPVERADRWVATLEAAAFSPIHAQVTPMGPPNEVTEELTKTVTRLAPALPRVAALFEVEVDPNAPFPKPLRPDYSKRRKDRKTGPDNERDGRSRRKPDQHARPATPAPGDASGSEAEGRQVPDDKPHAASASASGDEPEVVVADVVAVSGEGGASTHTESVAEAEAEAESVAEAEVVAEAEALTEASAHVAPEHTDDAGMAKISDAATEALESRSDEQAAAMAEDVVNDDSPDGNDADNS